MHLTAYQRASLVKLFSSCVCKSYYICATYTELRLMLGDCSRQKQLGEPSALLLLVLMKMRVSRVLEGGSSEHQHLRGIGREDSGWG